MGLAPDASGFLRSPGRAFFAPFANGDPATGMQMAAYATWITATTGRADCSVETGSAMSAFMRMASRASSVATRPSETPLASGVSSTGTGCSWIFALESGEAEAVETVAACVDDMLANGACQRNWLCGFRSRRCWMPSRLQREAPRRGCRVHHGVTWKGHGYGQHQ